MKKLLFILMIFCSCVSKKKTILGTYVSKTNLVNRLFINDIMLGIKLEIKENKQFTHQTCAQISDGSWWQSNDSLFLKCEHIKFKIDSFNHKPEYIKGTICDDEIEVYKISNQSLKRKITINNQTIYFSIRKRIKIKILCDSLFLSDFMAKSHSQLTTLSYICRYDNFL